MSFPYKAYETMTAGERTPSTPTAPQVSVEESAIEEPITDEEVFSESVTEPENAESVTAPETE